jgi:hypothetical protein
MASGEYDGTGDLMDVFFQIRQETHNSIDIVISVIEGARGIILHVFPPNFIIARIPQTAIKRLEKLPQVHSIDHDEISDERMERASEVFRLAFSAWNEYVRKKSPKFSWPKQTLTSWNTSGRQPPDPPAHLRDELRRREEKERKKNDDTNMA